MNTSTNLLYGSDKKSFTDMNGMNGMNICMYECVL